MLDPIGLADVKKDVEIVMESWGKEPFNQIVMGTVFAAFSEACLEVKKTAHAAQKNAVKIYQKVRKWKDTPPAVEEELSLWRHKTNTILDAMMQFDTKGKSGGDSGRMENCIACLHSYNVVIPRSFNTLFLKLRCIDLARYRNADALVETHASILELADAEEKEDGDANDFKDELDLFAREVLGEALLTFAVALGDKNPERLTKFEGLVAKLADDSTPYEPSMKADLHTKANINVII